MNIWFAVSTNLPPRRPPNVLRVIEWLTFVWAVSFMLASAVLS